MSTICRYTSLTVYRQEAHSIFASVDELARANRDLHENTVNHLGELKADLVQAARDKEDELKAAIDQATSTYEVSLQVVLQKMEKLLQASFEMTTANCILSSLRFHHLDLRESKIDLAHFDTCRWIFDEDTTPFASWLKDSEGVFWLSGKAGSGKSTIMKFVADHWRTEVALKQWAGGKTLVIVKYYFWCSGHPMQRTQDGLLQDLLFQLLRQCPELIPLATPRRWHAKSSFHKFPEQWSRAELANALAAVLNGNRLPFRFCFFIDGLDEYEGDHLQLIADFTHMAKSPDVKICVSSRPWTEFKTAFAHDDKRHLVLEHFTEKDMARYIKDTLVSHESFARLTQEDNRSKMFIKELKDTANGVFLWVTLAVRSLLRGLAKGDNLKMLQIRLRSLPKDLDAFFTRMLDSVEDCYRPYTAQALQLAVHSVDQVPVLVMWMLQYDDDTADEVSNCENAGEAYDLITSMQNQAISCVNNWCTDLLEVHQAKTLPHTSRHAVYESLRVVKVDFLHRTVRDYLKDGKIQAVLRDQAGVGFEPSSCLSGLYLNLLAFARIRSGKRDDIASFFYFAGVAMFYAKRLSYSDSRLATEYLDQLDELGKHVFEETPDRHWTNFDRKAAFRIGALGFVDRDDVFHNHQNTMLGYALTWGFQDYVLHQLDYLRQQGQKFASPLLQHAVRCQTRHPLLLARRFPDVKLAAELMSRGFDVNQEIEVLHGIDKAVTRTIWIQFLFDIYDKRTRGNMTSNEVEFALCALAHNADLTVSRKDRLEKVASTCKLPANFSVRAWLRYGCPRHRMSDLARAYDEAAERINDETRGLAAARSAAQINDDVPLVEPWHTPSDWDAPEAAAGLGAGEMVAHPETIEDSSRVEIGTSLARLKAFQTQPREERGSWISMRLFGAGQRSRGAGDKTGKIRDGAVGA
ncbi:hypothetical protein KC343_g3911 [Hortaea werneckii]|nr:hypothetical protein KC352_g11292 [Hortaea werneckii]KAI7564191.1 hypothetical protein KC317_g7217 [Hortaea werneckii]KAI7611949.1 hypothetical protein KC346_g8056 [Hortaea werneckii]KAI7631616.1 hypothetical protein KC343_g3911 [Hortaea werneckii]KAI7676593.1 hypothetical protein KC319_g4324 [Hortaea werneckii]